MGLARIPQMHVRVHEAGEQKAAIRPDLTGIGGKGPAEIGNHPVPHEQIERFVFQPLRRIGYSARGSAIVAFRPPPFDFLTV